MRKKTKWYMWITHYLIPVLTGFGIYNWYLLFNWNETAALFFALFATALVTESEDYTI